VIAINNKKNVEEVIRDLKSKIFSGLKPEQMKIRLKIGFTGTHGTGKTTAMYDLACLLKKEGFDVNIVTEVARSHPAHLPINLKSTAESQTWIFAKMIEKELEARGQIIICDRTLLDAFAYTYRIAPETANAMMPFINHHMKSYNLLFYMEPNLDYLKADGIREIDPKFQKDIKNIIDKTIETKGLKVSYAKTTSTRYLETLKFLKRMYFGEFMEVTEVMEKSRNRT